MGGKKNGDFVTFYRFMASETRKKKCSTSTENKQPICLNRFSTLIKMIHSFRVFEADLIEIDSHNEWVHNCRRRNRPSAESSLDNNFRNEITNNESEIVIIQLDFPVWLLLLGFTKIIIVGQQAVVSVNSINHTFNVVHLMYVQVFLSHILWQCPRKNNTTDESNETMSVRFWLPGSNVTWAFEFDMLTKQCE